MLKNGTMKNTSGVLITFITMLAVLISAVRVPIAASADEEEEALYSRTITINSGQVPSTQTDFPVLISLTDASLKDKDNGGHVARSDGGDIYFTDSSGYIEYPWEKEEYDGVSGSLTAWVKIPSLSDGVSFNMYYGVDSGTPKWNATGVWNSGFQGVWHMNQVNAQDSTVNNNAGTASSSGTLTLTNVTGKVDDSVSYPNSTESSTVTYIDVANSSSLDFSAAGSYTWSAWINPAALQSGGSGIIGKTVTGDNAAPGKGYELALAGEGSGDTVTLRFQTTSSPYDTTRVEYDTGILPGNWIYVTAVYNNGSVELYSNGASGITADNITTTDDTTDNLYIGYRRTKTDKGSFYGLIDEVQYSSVVRSPNWIRTEYNNQSNPGAFYTLGAEVLITPESDDATLSNLTISSGTFSPAFIPTTLSYSASVENSVNSITVTPTVNNSNATVKVNGSAVASGSASQSISPDVGENTINVIVTAEDGITTRTYTVTVTRETPLDHITVSPASATVAAYVQQTYTAQGYDADNNPLSTPVFTWGCSDEAAGSINSSGVFTAGIIAGTYTNVISATSGSITGYASVTVTVETTTITASSTSGGSISPSGDVEVIIRGNQTFTFTPNSGYGLDDVLVDGSSVIEDVVDNTYTFSDIQTSHIITASFGNYYTIATSLTADPTPTHMECTGSITPSGNVKVVEGNDYTFIISLYEDTTNNDYPIYHIEDVLVDGVSQGAIMSYTFTDVHADHTIEVQFAINTYTVTSSAGPNGTLNFVGTQTVNSGTTLSFGATADPGYCITKFIIDGHQCIPGWDEIYVRSYQESIGIIVLDHDFEVYAEFAPDTFQIYASAGENGSISDPGFTMVDYGTSQTYDITPVTGYHVEDVLVDYASVGAVTSYTFTDVTDIHSISATFAPDTGIPEANFTADVTSGPASLSVNFTDLSTNSPSSWAWDFDNDGTVDSTEQNPSYTFTTPGIYSVKLAATNASGTGYKTEEYYIRVTNNTWYVDDDGAVGVDCDFNTIQDAVAAASAFDVIIVKDGTYIGNLRIDNYVIPDDSDSGDHDRTGLIIRAENRHQAIYHVLCSLHRTGFSIIRVPFVIIDGFDIFGEEDASCGIGCTNSHHCTIINNRFTGDLGTGIILSNTTHDPYVPFCGDHTVSNNIIVSDEYDNGDGISRGIKLNSSSNNTITNNTIICRNGISLTTGYTNIDYEPEPCSNNLFADNVISFGRTGIFMEYTCFNKFIHNTITNIPHYRDTDYAINQDSCVAIKAGGDLFYLNSFGLVEDHILPISYETTGYWNARTPVTYWYNGNEYTGYPGNYWGTSGTDADGDGLAETAYELDNHPLVTAGIQYTDSLQAPVAAFTANNNLGENPLTIDELSGDNPFTVQFINISTGSGPLSFTWDFGDGNTSTEQNPSHTYDGEGTYTVTLTVTSALGSDSVTKTDFITVIPITAYFYARYPDINYAEGIAPYMIGHASYTVKFISESLGLDLTYEWDFDNDGIVDSTDEQGVYTYTEPGIYSVRLTVTNSTGSDTLVLEDYVTVLPAGPWIVDASGGGDFTTIMGALTWAKDGDTIIVRDGIYNEQVRIHTAVTLKSENLHGAVITTPGTEWYCIGASDFYGIIIDGFTIIGNGIDTSFGISCRNRNITCINNDIQNVSCGIYVGSKGNNVSSCEYAVIKNNTITLGDYTDAVGIMLKNSPYSVVSGNTVTDPYSNSESAGICIYRHAHYDGYQGGSYLSMDDTIYGNTCDGTGYGIWIRGADRNTIYSNTFENNQYGIYLSADSESMANTANTFYMNSIIDCAIAPVLVNDTDGVVNYNAWYSPGPITYPYNGSDYTEKLGNYWDGNYTGTDADGNGVGDTPYAVGSEELDFFPLISPKSDYTLIHIISAGAGDHGDISPSGGVSVAADTCQTFTITPEEGYRVQDVRVDGKSMGVILTYTFYDVNANHTIKVTFADASTVTISASSGENGAISPSGYTTVTIGEDQTFTITPDPGYCLSYLDVDGITVLESDDLPEPITTEYDYTFNNVTANHTIVANFYILTYYIRASAGANGSITPKGGTQVEYGGSQLYTITPSTGYMITDVLVDGVSKGVITSYEFTDVTAEHTIEATFETFTYAINAGAGDGGSITPSGKVKIDPGCDRTFTITADTGYRVADVLVNGVSKGALTSYKFTNVSANHTIEATFEKITYSITVTAGDNGSIDPSGEVAVDYGSSQTFTITPDTGYQVEDVLVDGVSKGAVTSYEFTDITANHTIEVAFASSACTGTSTVKLAGIVNEEGKFTQSVTASSSDNTVKIFIPENTIGLDAEGKPLSEITIQHVTDGSPAIPASFSLCGQVCEFGPEGATFDTPVTITISYDPALVTDDSVLAIKWYDTANGAWVEIASTVDTVNHTVSAQVTHFSEFAVMRNVSTTSAIVSTSSSSYLPIIISVIAAGLFFVVIAGAISWRRRAS